MTAKIKLNAASGGGSFSLQAPSSSANNRVFTLPDSADATLLTSTTATGKILQVLQTVIDSQVTIGTGTETEIFNVSITPSATSSKVLVCVNMAPCYTNSTSTEFKAIIYRDSTAISGLARYFGSGDAYSAIGSPNGMFLDSPNTTSATTYRMKTTRVGGSDSYVINHTNSEAKSSITVLEVAA